MFNSIAKLLMGNMMDECILDSIIKTWKLLLCVILVMSSASGRESCIIIPRAERLRRWRSRVQFAEIVWWQDKGKFCKEFPNICTFFWNWEHLFFSVNQNLQKQTNKQTKRYQSFQLIISQDEFQMQAMKTMWWCLCINYTRVCMCVCVMCICCVMSVCEKITRLTLGLV